MKFIWGIGFNVFLPKTFVLLSLNIHQKRFLTWTARDIALKIHNSPENWHKLFIMSHVYIIVECKYYVYMYLYLLELWLWPSPDVYISFLSVVRKHGISTFLAVKWRSAVKNPRQQEASVCIWMAEISGQSSCCSSEGNDILHCECDLSVCAHLILIYARRLKNMPRSRLYLKKSINVKW